MTSRIERTSAATSARSQSSALPGPLLMVDDGMLGGVRRVSDYLIDEWAHQGDGPVVERILLRGTGSLRSSLPTYVRGLAEFAARMVVRRPAAVHLNVTQRGSTWRAWPVVALARLGRVPVLLALHSSEYRTFTGELPRPALAAVRWMFGSVGVVAVLGGGWADYARTELRVHPDRLVVLPNAVPGPTEVRVHDPSESHTPRLLFLGRVGHRKGIADLLAALAQPDSVALPWQLTVAGDGDVEEYERTARGLGIADRVRFTGWLGPEQVAAELEDADIFVLPSHAEGLPLAVLEAMAYGLAVVTTPVGAIPEVIEDGETGLLAPPGDPDALGEVLRRVLASGELQENLGRSARSQWERDHDIVQGARRVMALYQRLSSR